MKSWSETLRLSRPLRDVRAAGLATGSCAGAATAAPDALQASYERGRIDGEKALSEQLLKQRAEMQTVLSGVLASLSQAVPQVIRDGESLIVSLALEVAQKLVADMPISVPMVEAAVRDALAQVEGTAKFTVRLHPADLELLQSAASPILSSCEDGGMNFVSWVRRKSRAAVASFKPVSARWMPGAKPNSI